MKKLIFVIIWLIFVDAGQLTDFWVELYTIDNVTVKVKRTDYLEMIELLDVNNLDYSYAYYYYLRNESEYYTELHKNNN